MLTYGTNIATVSWFLPVIGGFAGLQFLISLWALIARWDDELAYALASAANNRRLSDDFKSLVKILPVDFVQRFELLKSQYSHISSEDDKKQITDEERRIGMRAGLLAFQRACAGCKQTPVSMEPTQCDICGNFRN